MGIALQDILNTQFGVIVGAAVRAHIHEKSINPNEFKFNDLDFKIMVNGDEVNLDLFKEIIKAEDNIRPYVNDLKKMMEKAKILADTIQAVPPNVVAAKIREALVEKFKSVDLSHVLQPPEMHGYMNDIEVGLLSSSLKDMVDRIDKMVV